MKFLFIGLLFCSLNLQAKLDLAFNDEASIIAQDSGLSQSPQPPIPASQTPIPPTPLSQQRVLPTLASQGEMPLTSAHESPLPLPIPPQEIPFALPLQQQDVVPVVATSTAPATPVQAIETNPLLLEALAGQPTEITNIHVTHPKDAEKEDVEKIIPAGKTKPKKSSKKKKKEDEKLIAFDFKDEKLVNIINLIAAEKGINIILPQGNDAIKTTISFSQKKKITLSQAEKYMYQFLELAGYMMHPTDGFFVIAKKADNTEGREPVNLYISVPPHELPQSSETIRAMYFLTNFQVPATNQGTEPIRNILAEMLGQKKFMFDQKSNAIILHGPADKIASAMTIILELDAAGSPETVEVFPLFYTNADTIAKLIQGQISAVAKPASGTGRVQAAETSNYFAPNTRAIADPRTNSIILIGTEAAVTRIKSFVREFIDVAPETGRSILHVYDLQYLDAVEFAKVLKRIVTPTVTGQSEKEGGGGPNRFFEGVIITAQEERADETAREVATSAAASAVKGATGKVTLGGNRIIVTAKQDDWIPIKELIEQLDKPELQVIIEILILDIDVQGNKELEMQTRNPLTPELHDGNVQFQSAQIVAPILDPNNTNPQTLAADLLRLLVPDRNVSVATDLTVGSTVISFKDPCQDKIWALLSILDKWITTKIISHPFLVTKNNVKAKELLRSIRQGNGREVASGGVATVKIEDFKATLSVEVTPRISSLDRLNLQIRVDIDNFLTTNFTGAARDFTRTTRSVETNATLSTGQVLILGGLTQENDAESESKVPILGDIPILGYFFKSTIKTKEKTNLAILVHPTIVEPKLRSGQNRYTADRVELEKQRLESESLFNGQRDPVVRMFFNNMGKNGPEVLDDYLKEAHYGQQHTEGKYQPVDESTAVTPDRAA